MKKKPKVFYHPIEGSSCLAAYWYNGPYGDAIEASEGRGVYFQAPNGELLGVQFDDVDEKNDEQILTTKNGICVKVIVKMGQVEISQYQQKTSAA